MMPNTTIAEIHDRLTKTDTTPILISTGEKGGSGKSTTSCVLIDGYREAGQPVHVIDADGGLSDIAKTYGAETSMQLANEWGVATLYEKIKTAPLEHATVVSMPGNVATAMEEHGAAFFLALPDLAKSIRRPIIILWTMDNKRDGVEALRTFRTSYPGNQIYIVRNLFFGPDRSFDLLNNSNELKTILDAGGKIVDLPALATRVKTKLTNSRWPLATAREKLELFDRHELERWWSKASVNFRAAELIP